MDEKRIQVMKDWRVPTTVSELRSFLELCNYYRRFIRDYSEIVAPLTKLLWKNEKWQWGSECELAFKNLKEAMVKEPILAMPDMTKPFEVHIDASDVALGGVLVQEGHLIAFESQKLKDVETRYTAQEKELLAIIHCLRV